MPEEHKMYVLDRYGEAGRRVGSYMCGEAVALATGCRVKFSRIL